MIELDDWLRSELLRRAENEAPAEACGLISRGAGGKIALWAAENEAADPEHGFEIQSGDLLGILRQIEGRDETLVGVYHSHPGGEPSPSPADVETAARWPGLTWVIVAINACPHCGGATDPKYWNGVLA